MTKTALSSLKISQWPPRDRELWQAAKRRSDPFEVAGRASKLRPDTIDLIEYKYGAFLAWLSANGSLDADQRPIDRIDKDRIREFIDCHRDGRADRTVAK
jgi:hypothetical protein